MTTNTQLVILECHYQAAHRQITENDHPDDAWKNHQVQPFVTLHIFDQRRLLMLIGCFVIFLTHDFFSFLFRIFQSVLENPNMQSTKLKTNTLTTIHFAHPHAFLHSFLLNFLFRFFKKETTRLFGWNFLLSILYNISFIFSIVFLLFVLIFLIFFIFC